MSDPKYPVGWDQTRVQRVLEHYDEQDEDEAVAEDEAAYEAPTHTAMEVPVELVPIVRELIAKRRASRSAPRRIMCAAADTRPPDGGRFELDGQRVTAFNGGPVFTFNEAVSFEVRLASQDEIDYYMGEALRRRRSEGTAVRLAEGQVRPLVAGRP